MSEKFKRDHHCGTLTKADSGKEVAYAAGYPNAATMAD